jgi:hypothetical protein
MSEHAAAAVTAAAGVDGAELDYSVPSLDRVDGILGRFYDERVAPSAIAETLFVFGAYIGSVIVRQNEGRWVDLPDDHPLGNQWPMVELDQGRRVVNPVGKAFKRVESGPVESVSHFYAALVAR